MSNLSASMMTSEAPDVTSAVLAGGAGSGGGGSTHPGLVAFNKVWYGILGRKAVAMLARIVKYAKSQAFPRSHSLPCTHQL